jgi:hypothetical protein
MRCPVVSSPSSKAGSFSFDFLGIVRCIVILLLAGTVEGIDAHSILQAVSQAGWCVNYLELELGANNYFLIDVGAGNMLFRSRVNGVNDQTSIPFDGTANRYWRIRHDQSANLIYFETSANESGWLTRKTVTPGISHR